MPHPKRNCESDDKGGAPSQKEVKMKEVMDLRKATKGNNWFALYHARENFLRAIEKNKNLDSRRYCSLIIRANKALEKLAR